MTMKTRTMMSTRSLLLATLVALCGPSLLQARARQSAPDYPPAVAPGNSTGAGSQYYSAHADGIDTVNLLNGNVQVQLPLATLGGRAGMDLSLQATYTPNGYWTLRPRPAGFTYDFIEPSRIRDDGGGWNVLLSTDWFVEQILYQAMIRDNLGGFIAFLDFYRYIVHGPDGSTHEL